MRRISAALIIFVLAFLASNTVFSQDPKPETSPKSDTKPKPETKKGEPGKTDPTDPNKVPGANNGLNDGNQDSGKDGKGTKTEGLPAISLGKTEIYEPSLKALTMLFVIAVMLESAFALLFSWRVFLTYCSVSGVKTIVMLFIAWVVVYSYDVDILASLINVYREKPAPSQPVSMLITAMILAGGSAAVNKIFVAIGFRSIPVAPPDIKPPETKAWVAVLVTRKDSVGRVHVELEKLREAGVGDPAPIAGTACARAPNIFSLLFRNPNRFPANGGYEVVPGYIYRLSVSGKDAAGAAKSQLVGTFVFANRAIVDFDVTF